MLLGRTGTIVLSVIQVRERHDQNKRAGNSYRGSQAQHGPATIPVKSMQ